MAERKIRRRPLRLDSDDIAIIISVALLLLIGATVIIAQALVN